MPSLPRSPTSQRSSTNGGNAVSGISNAKSRADLIGLFVTSHNENRYVLTLIEHCTGWAKAFPLKDKTNASVWQAWVTHVLQRHSTHEDLITDNCQEFEATTWRTYLTQSGVEHRTSFHPQE